MNIRIGFIGAGNMGSAMIRSIVKSGIVSPDKVLAYAPNKAKLNILKEETGIGLGSSAGEVAESSDVVILAVKPNMVKQVLEEVKDRLDTGKILVSVAVGIPIGYYKKITGDDIKVVRTMPNTPSLIGEGMTLISFDHNIEREEMENIKALFQCFGKVEVLEEKLMTEATALTGSSPAYVFMFIEAMADGAVLAGIPRGLAYKLASQAVLGSAKMVLETGKHPGELKDQVCSPAGTTIEAVKALEKSGFRSAVIEAMDACTKRAKEIGRQFEA